MVSARVSVSEITPITGNDVPGISMPSSDGETVNLATLTDMAIVFVQPGASNPNNPPSEDWLAGWKQIQGAAGCTGQCKTFNEVLPRLSNIDCQVFGLSGQSPDEQAAVHQALGLQYPLLSDADALFLSALGLKQFEYQGRSYHPRLTLVINNGVLVNIVADIEDPAQHVLDLVKDVG